MRYSAVSAPRWGIDHMDDRDNAVRIAEGLSAREKGDIYWRKLKYFLQAVKDKHVTGVSERKGRYMARQLVARKKDAAPDTVEEYIDGNEFRMRPPTSTGEQAYEDSIWKAIRNLNYFRSVLSQVNESDYSEADIIVLKQLNELQKVIGETVEACFTANGIDYRTGEAVSASQIKIASAMFSDRKEKYEESVKQFKLKVAKAVASAAAGNTKDDPAEGSEFTDLSDMKALIEANPEKYQENKAVINNALNELESIRKKLGKARAGLAALKEYAEQQGPDAKAVSFMDYSEVVQIYEDDLDESLTSMEWGERGCETCIRSLLTGDVPDPLMSNYMHSHWSADTETFSADSSAVSLPGYQKLEYEKDDAGLYHYGTIAEIRQGIGELARYRDEHPRQFRFQMISDLLFGLEDLPEIAGRSRAISYILADWAKNGCPETISDADKKELKEMWVQAETTERVAEMVLEYHRDSERRTLKDLTDNYLYDSLDMDYRLQEKKVRTCLDNWFFGQGSRLTS